MQLLKRSFAFYVFGNVHVAIAAYCLTKITFLQFDIQNQPLANFIFFSTILAYNCIRIFQINSIQSMTSIWIGANKKGLIILNLLTLAGVIYYGIGFKLNDFFVLLPFVLATVFYVIPLSRRYRGLRHVPGLKLLLISFTWAGITLYLPLFGAGLHETQHLWLYFLQRFLLVMAITIPFDIRDASFDQPELATLPQILGTEWSKIIALTGMAAVTAISWYLTGSDHPFFKIDVFMGLMVVLMILYTNEKRGRYFTAFWVEAIPVLWYLLYLLSKHV